MSIHSLNDITFTIKTSKRYKDRRLKGIRGSQVRVIRIVYYLETKVY